MDDQSQPLILLVDDDVDCLEVNRHFLEAAGYRVACCFDPDEALVAMQKDKPDLVVTDLMMKSLDAGFGFARRIKQDPQFGGIPVIVVTAVGTQMGFDFRPKNRADLTAMNADAFLSKPVSPLSLIDKVKELLSR